MEDRIKQIEEFTSLLAIAKLGESPGCPDGSVCVLSARLAYAWNVTFNISRIMLNFVERWWEEQRQPVLWENQSFQNRLHRLLAANGIASSTQYSPRLGNSIDLAFSILDRAEWETIIIISTAIPRSIPGSLFNCGSIFLRPSPVIFGCFAISPVVTYSCEALED